MNIECSTINQIALSEQEKHHLLVLPYAGNKREKILKLMNKFTSRVLPCNVKTCIIYYGTKLSSRFQLKDQMKKGHQHEVVYYAKYPKEQCTEDYMEESGRHLIEQVKDQSGRDINSYLFKRLVGTNHKMVTLEDFKIVGKGCKRPKFRRNLAELLHIKKKPPSLNTQKPSVPLKLFN